MNVQGASADVIFRTESGPAGLEAQQAEQPAVVADDRGPPAAGGGHRLVRLSQTGPGRHGTTSEPSQRYGGGFGSLVPRKIIALHHGGQPAGRADDQRGVDMIITEEITDLADGGAQRMPERRGEHGLGNGARHFIHWAVLGAC